MYALFDFAPHHCPNCGTAWQWTGRPTDRGGQLADFYAGASHLCPARCGLQYQFIDTATLLRAATEAGGDLGRY